MKIILLKRNPLSRLANDSMRFCDASSSLRRITRIKQARMISMTKTKNQTPSSLPAKACTDERIPLRVRYVPKMVRVKVAIIRIMFHRRSMFFFSWMRAEWRYAVAVSQGRREAFSTGSQAQ